LVLSEATPDETHDRRIIVALRLRGVVMNLSSEQADGLRAGIEFVDLTDEALAYLESLARAHGRW